MAWRAVVHPVYSERILERIEHFNLGRLVEVYRGAPCRRTSRKRFKGIIPVLKILQLLAEAVIQERESSRVIALTLDETP